MSPQRAAPPLLRPVATRPLRALASASRPPHCALRHAWRLLAAQCAAAGACFAGEDDVVLEETERGRVFFTTSARVSVAELEALCSAVGWPRRPAAKVSAALENSFLVAALVEESAGSAAAPPLRQLVGLARATSDGAFEATLWDVLVSPRLQRRGLGRALVQQTMRLLLARGLSVSLFADPAALAFWEQLGFVQEPGGLRGLFFRPPQRQSIALKL